MRRTAAEHLDAGMNSPLRKPLLVQGARQVGKTWLIKDFGSRRFNAVAYVSFLDDDPMRKAFDDTLDPERLLDAITLFTGVDAKAETTLVVFDEVQECPRALMAMKAFAENRPQTFLIAAGCLAWRCIGAFPFPSARSIT